MNLRAIDLNLLPVFEAVFAEGGITRAAERLNLTQPAVSNALARLRAAFDDQLFVRTAGGMAPTPAAKAMIGPVREALAQLRVGLDRQAAFDPANLPASSTSPPATSPHSPFCPRSPQLERETREVRLSLAAGSTTGDRERLRRRTGRSRHRHSRLRPA